MMRDERGWDESRNCLNLEERESWVYNEVDPAALGAFEPRSFRVGDPRVVTQKARIYDQSDRWHTGSPSVASKQSAETQTVERGTTRSVCFRPARMSVVVDRQTVARGAGNWHRR